MSPREAFGQIVGGARGLEPSGVTLAFTLGLLAALGLMAALAYFQGRDRALGLAGLLGLGLTGATSSYFGLLALFLPVWAAPWLHPLALLFAAASMGVWGMLAAHLTKESTGALRLASSQRFLGLLAMEVGLLTLLPYRVLHDAAEALLGVIVPLLGGATLVGALRAGREGVRGTRALVLATLAMLLFSGSLATLNFGLATAFQARLGAQVALCTLAAAVGWALLERMDQLRRATDEAHAARHAADQRQAEHLEAQVQARSAELVARLKDLEDARRSGDAANLALQRAMRELEEAASTDRLTGAWNRRRFEEAVVPEMALAQRRREPVSVLLLDLDHFKRVNDSFGHLVGDTVLSTVAQTLRQHLRASDSLVRWGGEEFLVLAPATRGENARMLGEKLRQAVAGAPHPVAGAITVSLGVAEYRQREGLTSWIDRADQALYQAKEGGRNQVVLAQADGDPGAAVGPGLRFIDISWDESHASGNALIDDQHERLFRMAGSLLSLVTENRPLVDAALRLETLIAYTAQHFHDEEALLRDLRYPELEEHMATHRILLAMARNFQQDAAAGQVDLAALISFLALDLVRGHLLGVDRDYFPLTRPVPPTA